ncbi:MAG: phospho-sugar mutase, partial [Thermoguttaceae bacterium]|nr:phospho-sugar mutase [Thermoguttaceae bacterium]
IGGAIEENDPAKYVLGMEESYGFLVGTHARDKDAAVAAMVFCEMAAKAKTEGKTVHQKLDEIYARYGKFAEKAFSVAMLGSDGMAKMNALMAGFQNDPPKALAGLDVVSADDYEHGTTLNVQTGERTPLAGPKGKLVILHLSAEGNYVAVRPSGTEPKVKFYLFASLPPGVEGDVFERLDALEAALKK